MKKQILLFVIAFLGVSTLSAQEWKQVDYRFAPQWHVSCICFPDDTCKTMVGPLGQLLYDYGGKKFYRYNGLGFRTVFQLLADENEKINSQRLYSSRVPVVITESTYAGMDITQEIFAVGMDYTRNKVSTKKGNREDIILTTITNNSSQTQTIHPVLVVNSEHAVTVDGRTVTIDGKAQLIVSEKNVRIRKNLADFKTLVEFEPVQLPPNGKKQIVALFDNGKPSVLAGQFKDNVSSLTNRIDAIKKEVTDYWENKTEIPYGHISVPDKEIQHLMDASLRGIWQAREINNDKITFQVGPTCFRGLWIVDGSYFAEAATMFNRGLDAREGIEYTLSFQQENGKFGKLRDDFWKENGLVLWTSVRHAMLMQDKEWLKSVWPQLRKTVGFIKEMRKMTLENDIPLDDGLIPPGYIDGGLDGSKEEAEYTNIYFNLAGLKAMIQAAHWLGEKKDAEAWEAEYADFYSVFQKAAYRDRRTDTFGNLYLPVSMDPKYQYMPQRAQWAFCQAVYPGQIFAKDDSIATGTLDMLHTTLQEGMVMGTGWIVEGIWTYFASFYGHACLWLGDGKRANESLYAFANHASPLYAWREEMPPRDLTPSNYGGDMPHNWASAEFLRLAVHLLALDRGDEMHLLEGIPQEWLRPGMKTSLNEISTPFGKLSFTLQVDEQGKTASLNIKPLSDVSCKGIFVHLGEWGTSDGENLVKLDAKKASNLTIKLNNRWSEEKANNWYQSFKWLNGVNYIPSDAINYTAMWDKTSFNPTLIDKELAIAQSIGLNCVRVVLQYAVYADDPQYFLKTLDRFLGICDAHGIKVMPAFFDDCVFGTNTDPVVGKQDEPREGWYAWAWSPSPGHTMVKDKSSHPLLEKYVKDVLRKFKDDQRIFIWDLYNEPTNSNNIGSLSIPLVKSVFVWAREINPSQPLTMDIWNNNKELNDIVFANSDIISFHNYGSKNAMEKQIQSLRKYNRPLICSEWMNRPRKSTVEDVMPVLKKENVGGFMWGLINGKTQTHLPWGFRPEKLPYTGLWQHDLFHSDFKPYNVDEIEIIKKMNGITK